MSGADTTNDALRVFLTGGWGYGNRGDDAILAGTLHGLSGLGRPIEYHLTSYSPKETTRLHGIKADRSVHRLLSPRRPEAMIRVAACALWRRGLAPMPASLRRQQKLMAESDVILFGGGGYFNEVWRDAFPARMIELELARGSGTQYLLLGQTFGPFSDRTVIERLAGVLGGAKAVTYRDTGSARVLDLAGVEASRRSYTADLAHLVPAGQPVGKRGAVPKIGLTFQEFRPYGTATGLVPLGRLGDAARYVAALLEVVEGLAQIPGATFSMITSTTRNEPFMRKLEKSIRKSGIEVEFHSLKDSDTRMFIDACQSVDVMLSTNMHPIILASMALIPSIALSYNFKVNDYMERIGKSDQCFRLDDFDPGEVIECVEISLKSTRPDLDLAARISESVSQAARNIDLVSAAVAKNQSVEQVPPAGAGR